MAGAAFSLRQGISSLVHPTATSSFTVAYVVLGVSTVFDAVSLRQSAHQMSVEARGIEAALRHESSYIYRVDVVPVGEDRPRPHRPRSTPCSGALVRTANAERHSVLYDAPLLRPVYADE